MATRVVEGKKPYTGGKAISIDENKVISLNLRDENNLIIYDAGDDEIYVDLQLPDEIQPLDAFPVGITTGRVISDNGWDAAGTIICAKTTSGDNIKILYEDNGKLWIDNGTGVFKQIYLKGDVDALLQALRNYVDTELAKKQDTLIAGNNIQISAQNVISAKDTTYSAGTGISISSNTISNSGVTSVNNSTGAVTVNEFSPSGTPSVGDVVTKTANGYEWAAPSGGDVMVSSQSGNILTSGMKIWAGTESDYSNLSSYDSNTVYLTIE